LIDLTNFKISFLKHLNKFGRYCKETLFVQLEKFVCYSLCHLRNMGTLCINLTRQKKKKKMSWLYFLTEIFRNV